MIKNKQTNNSEKICNQSYHLILKIYEIKLMHLDSNDTPPKLCPRLSESQIFFTTEHILNCSFLNSQVFCVWRGKTALLMQGKVCDCLALALSKSYSSCFSVTFFFKKHSNVMQVSLVLTFWGLK